MVPRYAGRLVVLAERRDGPWGEAIVYWLRRARLTQQQLAEKTGMAPKTISGIVRGFHTRTENLQRIADVLGVTLDQVLIAPERRMTSELQKRIVFEAAAHAMRQMAESSASEDEAFAQLDKLADEDARLHDVPRQHTTRKRKKKKRS